MKNVILIFLCILSIIFFSRVLPQAFFLRVKVFYRVVSEGEDQHPFIARVPSEGEGVLPRSF